MKTYHIKTYGCQMNYSDSERMETYLQALNLIPCKSYQAADIVIFNTCSIRQKAEDRVFSEMYKLEKLKRKKDLIVIVTGCMIRKSSSRYSAERDALFPRMPALDIALRIDEMPNLAALLREIQPELKIEAIKEESLEDYFQIGAAHNSHQAKTQAFVAISNGCDKFCTYCIVPYSRGREKSRKMADIITECEKLVESGVKEITLIGQTVNSYGLGKADEESGKFAHLEGKEPFVHLLETLDSLREKGLERIRFTSPHPKDMSDQLIEAMATLKTQMPYLHLPVQSGDNRTLKRMNRTYTVEEYRTIIEKLRAKIPDISISTDVIVGFCGETEEEFEKTLKFYEEMSFEHAYIAQYSERRGTTADRFMKDDVPRNIKKQRWHKLNSLLVKMAERGYKRFLDKTVNVLVENQSGKTCMGRSEHFKAVQFNSGRKLLGKIVPVKITKAREILLEGELV